MSVACQGLGASVWYPCKDHQSDEPDNGATLHITVPDSLIAVGNGRLIRQNSHADNVQPYTWAGKIADQQLQHHSLHRQIRTFGPIRCMGEKGKLDLNYWVLDYNLAKGQKAI